jgi:peroxiredoxin
VVRKKWAGKVNIVGVAWNGTQGEIDEFISRHGLTFPNVRDDDGEIFASFSVASQPAWVFQSKTGERVVESRALPEDQVNAKLSAIAPPT